MIGMLFRLSLSAVLFIAALVALIGSIAIVKRSSPPEGTPTMTDYNKRF